MSLIYYLRYASRYVSVYSNNIFVFLNCGSGMCSLLTTGAGIIALSRTLA